MSSWDKSGAGSQVLELASTPGGQPADPNPMPALRPLMRDFLAWVAAEPRTRADVMETWQTSCPRYAIWEDALDAGFVRLESCGWSGGPSRVVLTARGQAGLGNPDPR